jgi:hypothetical protein
VVRLKRLLWPHGDPVTDRATNELLHGVFIHAFQLQVAVFCGTLQYTLAFKKAGYAVADSVDEYGEFFLNRRIGALESDLALFVFCVNAIQGQHMEVEHEKTRSVAGVVARLFYAFLRLTIPKPSRAEPKSQTAAGTGTADTPMVKASPHISAWS